MDEEFSLIELEEDNGKRHCALHIPRNLPEGLASEGSVKTSDIFNIFMGDVSGSMYAYWPQVVIGWQEYIKDKLMGQTKIFVFDTRVQFMRDGVDLKNEDNSGGGTNITSALRRIRDEVDGCSQSNVRIFIITDGGHNHGPPLPETQIDLMSPPMGKTVSVYLLGIGAGFPVNYSVDIRSKMHNGNSNVPTLFWAKETEDIVTQVMAIGEELNSGLVKLKLNTEGLLLPGLDKTDSVHLGEWVYFDEPPEELPSLSISVNDEPFKPFGPVQKPSTVQHLLDGIFRQWNSILIQQHRKKAHVPKENFGLMESLFNYHLNIINQTVPTGTDVKSRLLRKQMKTCQVDYQTLMNQSKSVIEVEGKYQNEMELAETILKSTVVNRKFDVKNLKLKGHGQDEFETDLKEFKKIYAACKPKLMELPTPVPDDCCNVTITSTLGDLQDPNFELLLEENKFTLLKMFNMTGIPIYAPVRDASQINPWTMVIKHILVTPFTILSQQVLEQSAEADLTAIGAEDKDVLLQKDNEKTRFNAIIPLVPASAANVLKPIVSSNIYAMMSTFCILKNPHIVDYNAHIAALACAWMRTVTDFPLKNRPTFATRRIEAIVATAKVYMGRPSIKLYVNTLIQKPKQALMTESTEEFDNKTLKCESLIKPLFFMYMNKDKFTVQQRSDILDLLLYEFIGRCLSSYKADESEATPYTDFFCAQLSDKDKRKAWLESHCKTVIGNYQNSKGDLLEEFFTLDQVIPGLKQYVNQEVLKLMESIKSEIEVKTNMTKVSRLKNYGACGDIQWDSFKIWAEEMEINDKDILVSINSHKAMAYINSALQVKNSRERLSKDLPTCDTVLDDVSKKVMQENTRTFRSTIFKEVEEFAVNEWRSKYMKIHNSVLVMPMSQEEIVAAAQAKGISVTIETFKNVYRRYSERLGLLRNACQIPACPHFLQPHNNFNQHISVEREGGSFPHALHLVSQEFCKKGLDDVISEVVSGKHAGTNERKAPPPPVSDVLQPLVDDIRSLLVIYSKDHHNTIKDAPSRGEQLDEEDHFYDCDS